MNHSFKTFAGLLLGAVAIVGCQREPVAQPNPNYNPDTDEVNAQFVMSVSTGASETKMSATAVQKATNFRGIDNAKLILFANNNGNGNGASPYVKKTGNTYKQVYNLGNLFTTGAITPAQNDDASSNRIVQLTIPVGCDAALFYGKAGIVSGTLAKASGKMEFNHFDDDEPENTYFAVSRRIGDSESDVTAYDHTAALMIYAINTIIQTHVDPIASYGGYTDLPALSWYELGDLYDAGTSTCFLGESMGMAYSLFTHIKSGEYRAGSSGAVKKMMEDMYAVVSATINATALDKDETNVRRLALAVETNMNLFFTNARVYKNLEDIQTAIVPSKMSQTDWNTAFSGARDLNDYPYGDFQIPVGAAQLAYNPTNHAFSYKHPNDALVTPGRDFEPRKYIYAPELCYYVNSPLLVTSKADLQISDYPNGVSPWNAALDAAGSKWKLGNWKRDKVESSTRGVAVQNNISYGVALMETSVAWSADVVSSGTLEDNRYEMTDHAQADRSIPKEDAKFILRGVLIGGVHARYDWQFLPRKLTAAEQAELIPGTDTKKYGNFDGVIYDDDIPNTAIPTPTGEPNYTLVYDNYDWIKADDAAQNDVYVALELVNNGDPFWGRDNLIPNNGVFYLGAKLSVAPDKIGDTSGKQSITWPTHYQVPPIDETTGLSKQIERVFIQDFLTKVTFRIGKQSLHYAYLTIPDLRSSQMSLGLSVDLSWKNGYIYDLEFGNNTGPGPVPDPDPHNN